MFWQRWLSRATIAIALTLATALQLEPRGIAQTDFAPYSGELLYVNDGGIWRFNLTTNESGRFIQAPGGIISHLALSPDHRRLAYTVTYYTPTFSVRSSDVVVCDADGANARTVAHEEDSGYFLGWVTWPNDPSRLVYGKVNWGRGFSERIEDVDLGNGERRLILENSTSPAASPTEQVLSYQTRAGTRWNIWKLDRETRERKELVPADWFDDADHPTFSPDGAAIAFVAAGAGPSPPVARESPMDLLGLGRIWVAAAHDLFGVLFDLWTVRPNGEGLRPVATLLDQQPKIAWSPAGRHIASLGSFQLQIVDVTTGVTRALPRPPGSVAFGGPLTWGPGASPSGR